jgi:hypothetical protein
MRHGAVGIVLRNLLEFFFRLFVPEGVQQSYAALEGLLHGRDAGHREGNGPELGRSEVFVVVLVIIGEGSERKERGNKQKASDTFHGTSLRSEFTVEASSGQTRLAAGSARSLLPLGRLIPPANPLSK